MTFEERAAGGTHILSTQAAHRLTGQAGAGRGPRENPVPFKVGSKVSCWRRKAGAAICTVCVVSAENGSSKIWQGSRAPESRLPHSTISSERNHEVPHQREPIMLMRHRGR